LSSKITLFYLENLENYDNKKDLALLSQGKSKFLEDGKENYLPPQEKKFEVFNMAPQVNSLRTFYITLPNLIHQLKKRNLKS